MSSIKRQWIARLMALTGELQSDGTFRKVERKTDLFFLAATLPALHVVIGAEASGPDGQDHQGYELELPVDFKIIIGNAKDPYDECDRLAELVQTKLESDEQLVAEPESGSTGPLVNMMEYEGDQPFSNEVNQPLAGTILFYRVKYRRQRGRPEIKY